MLAPTNYFVPFLLWGTISSVLSDNRENDRRYLIAAGTECVTQLRISEFDDGSNAMDWLCKFSREDANQFGGYRSVEIAGVSHQEMTDMGAVPGETILKFGPSDSISENSDSFLIMDSDHDYGALYLSLGADFTIEDMNPSIDARHHKYRRATREQRRNLAPSTTGTLDTVVVLVIDADNHRVPKTADQMYQEIFVDEVSLANQYGKCSHDKIEIRPVALPGIGTVPGVIEVAVNVTAEGSDRTAMWSAALDEAESLTGRDFENDFDLVMVCLPPGTTSGVLNTDWRAFGEVNSYLSAYNGPDMCESVSVQMQQIGHNLGLSRSNMGDNQLYGDTTGVMGYVYKGKTNALKCFNAAKSYQLGWYDTTDVDHHALDGKSENFELTSVIDYGDTGGDVVIRLGYDYYIGYNRAGDFNSDTNVGRNEVHLVKKNGGGPYNPGQSSSHITTLEAGDVYGWNIDGFPVKLKVDQIILEKAYITLTGGTPLPTSRPTTRQTSRPTHRVTPSFAPSNTPSFRPSNVPSSSPSNAPSHIPSYIPSDTPSDVPSDTPSFAPSSAPSNIPSFVPSNAPSNIPSDIPSDAPSDAPSGARPPDFPARSGCGTGNGGLRYRVTLRTDTHGDETSIASYSFDEDYKDLDEPVFQRTRLESNNEHVFPSNDKYYCLEHNRCYYLEVTDTGGDGIEANENDDPVFEAYLGKKRIVEGVADFGNTARKIFCTGNKCMDKEGFSIGKGKNKKNCRSYVKGGLNAMKKKCKKKYKGKPIHTHCPATCGQRAGVGECRWWKDVAEKLKKERT